MGVKIVFAICGIACVTSILNFTGALLPMHRLRFYGFMMKPLADMRTHLTSIDFRKGESEFCSKIRHSAEGTEAFKSDKKKAEKEMKKAKEDSDKFCHHLKGGHDIQDVAMHMCTPIVRFIWPEFCDGLNAAHGVGIALIVTMVANVLLQAIGCYMLYDYATRKANPMYREIGAGMLAAGGLLYAVVLIIYFFSVVHHLDAVRTSGIMELVLSVDKADGTGSGFIICALSCAFQLVQLALIPMVAREHMEDQYWDNKLMKEEAREYGATGFGNSAAGFGNSAAGFGTSAAGFGAAPAAQQGMMFSTVQPTTVMVGGPVIIDPVPVTAVAHFEQTTIVTSGGGPAMTYNAGPSAPRELGV